MHVTEQHSLHINAQAPDNVRAPAASRRDGGFWFPVGIRKPRQRTISTAMSKVVGPSAPAADRPERTEADALVQPSRAVS